MAKDVVPRVMNDALWEDFAFPAELLAKNQTVKDRLRDIKAMKLGHNDVLVCSYPKSGTHWVGNLVSRLLDVNDDEKLLQVITIESGKAFTHFRSQSRVQFSHLSPQLLPEEHLNTGGKVILCLREPKDATVSYFRHLDNIGYLQPRGSWDAFLGVAMSGRIHFGSFVQYIKHWNAAIENNKNLNVAVIFYEDLVTNGLSTLKKLQDHLGTNKSDEALQEILEQCSFGQLKQQASRVPKTEIASFHQTTDGNFAIYRKGEIGDWKNYFTEEQTKRFDIWLRANLKHCSLVRRWGFQSSL